ncbi:MAG: diguanylate cyclase [Nitrospirae bacterium]|nr:diguanylate cyclase [Nitrospirota bacterium]
MEDRHKTKEQLIEELHGLRRRIEALENDGVMKTADALRKSEKDLRNITSNLAEGIYVLNEQGRIVFMNPEAERLLGWAIDELNEKGPHELVHCWKEDGTPLPFEECNMHNVFSTGKQYSSTDEVFLRKDGTVFPISVITSPVIEDGKIVASVTAFRDITERKKMEEQLKAISVTDELTGLFNRRGFFTLAEKEFKLANRNRRRMSLLYLDLDGMKKINDELGHTAGDQALTDAANVLRKSFRDSDIIGRIGGDEFAVLITEASEADIENIIMKNIRNNLRAHNEHDGRDYRLLLSMGMAHYDPEAPCPMYELMAQADTRMYEDKKRNVQQKKASRTSKSVRTERRVYTRYQNGDDCLAQLGDLGKFGIKDISAGGICLKPFCHLPVNSTHKIIISSPANGAITTTGAVVWASLREAANDPPQYEVGLKFIGMNSATERSVNNFIFINKFAAEKTSKTI